LVQRSVSSFEEVLAARLEQIKMPTFRFIIVGLFVSTWRLAIVIWRIGRIEERWAARSVETQTAAP
jgi:high-affinity nickel-transport protein